MPKVRFHKKGKTGYFKFIIHCYDLASFNNVQDTTALEAMTKAMYGETEMAKQLGLNLSATTMENSEYVKSLGKSWSALTQAEKAEAQSPLG